MDKRIQLGGVRLFGTERSFFSFLNRGIWGNKGPKGRGAFGLPRLRTELWHLPSCTKGRQPYSIHFGGGWYTHSLRSFGSPEAIFRIFNRAGESIISVTHKQGCFTSLGSSPFLFPLLARISKPTFLWMRVSFLPSGVDNRGKCGIILVSYLTNYFWKAIRN